MTALPIDPTDEQVRVWLLEFDLNQRLRTIVQDAHAAGVEAERARVAAETTEEWGALLSDGEISQAPKETVEQAIEVAPDIKLVRRLVGPWEVQS